MSLWADYIKERENCETIEDEFGFLTYKITDDGSIFIRDFFVEPSRRNRGHGEKLFERLIEIARAEGASEFICNVDTRKHAPELSLGVILSRGFSVVGADRDVIVLKRSV